MIRWPLSFPGPGLKYTRVSVSRPELTMDLERERLRLLALLGDDKQLGGVNVPSPRAIATALGNGSLCGSEPWLAMCRSTVKEWRGNWTRLLLPGGGAGRVRPVAERGGHVDLKRGKGGKASIMLKLKGAGAGSYRPGGGNGADLVPCPASDSRASAIADGDRASVQFGTTTHAGALHVLAGCCHWWYLASGGDAGVEERHKFTNATL